MEGSVMDDLNERAERLLAVPLIEQDYADQDWPALIRDLDAALTAEREAHEETRRERDAISNELVGLRMIPAWRHVKQLEKQRDQLKAELASIREAMGARTAVLIGGGKALGE